MNSKFDFIIGICWSVGNSVFGNIREIINECRASKRISFLLKSTPGYVQLYETTESCILHDYRNVFCWRYSELISNLVIFLCFGTKGLSNIFFDVTMVGTIYHYLHLFKFVWLFSFFFRLIFSWFWDVNFLAV